MDKSLIEKLAGNVPRYTSYPTAAQFHAGIDARIYESWLETTPPDKPVSLYLHIPYCHKLCWYCACHTTITSKYDRVAAYAELLKKEIALVSQHLQGRQQVCFIHWGGGSPNMVSVADFQDLMDSLKKNFKILKTAENAMEVDPRSMTREKAEGFVRAGINRVSLGVQDFNPHVQKRINRIQPFTMIEKVVAWFRGAEVKGVNFDLIYGLPGQTLGDVKANARRAVELSPDRLAVFGYAHVPWMKTHQKMIQEAELPSPALRLEMANAMARILRKNGYVKIGLDHFAKPVDSLVQAFKAGTLRRNFQGYTTDQADILLGFGASAISRLEDGFAQNTTDMKAYRDLINAGCLATVRGVEVTSEDRRRWKMIETLMCQLKISQTDLFAFKPEAKTLARFQRGGLLKERGGNLCLSARGRPYVRSIATVFDQYLEGGQGRHSKAV